MLILVACKYFKEKIHFLRPNSFLTNCHQGQQWLEWWDVLSEPRMCERSSSSWTLHWPVLSLAHAALHHSLWVGLFCTLRCETENLISELREEFTTQIPTVLLQTSGGTVCMRTSTLVAVGVE